MPAQPTSFEAWASELATLLREPPIPVIAVLRDSLPALLLRVRIIAEAVAEQRKAERR